MENQLKIKKHNSELQLLSSDERFELYTDFISDYKDILCWGFAFETLMSAYSTEDYSMPVRRALFQGFEAIAVSGNRRVRERHFTVWMGDYGSENQYFCVAVPFWMLQRAKDVLDSVFTGVQGFMFMECCAIPYMPLIPIYRFEYGIVVEYTYEESMSGKMKIDTEYGTGLSVIYREWLSAEEYDIRQKYRG